MTEQFNGSQSMQASPATVEVAFRHLAGSITGHVVFGPCAHFGSPTGIHTAIEQLPNAKREHGSRCLW